MAPPPLVVCILAGGSGERFWPLSRLARPKQFLSVLGGQSLLARSVARARPLCTDGHLVILTSASLAEATRAECPGVDVLAEPARRDTGPAAALATAYARTLHPDAVVVLLPSDPWIGDDALFREDLTRAADLAATTSSLVTLAVPPTHPSTGFGYLELAEPLAPGARRVARFMEKPDLETAQRFLESGRHAWNAGMFIWKASAFLEEAGRSAPELAAFIRGWPAGDASAYLATAFPALPRVSVDYAVMEHARSVAAVEARFSWDDVGTWTALAAHLPPDASGNTLTGATTAHDSRDCIAMSTGRTIALCGVSDLVVVETPDAVLVCHRSRVQDIKGLLQKLPPALH